MSIKINKISPDHTEFEILHLSCDDVSGDELELFTLDYTRERPYIEFNIDGQNKMIMVGLSDLKADSAFFKTYIRNWRINDILDDE